MYSLDNNEILEIENQIDRIEKAYVEALKGRCELTILSHKMNRALKTSEVVVEELKKQIESLYQLKKDLSQDAESVRVNAI